MVAQKKQTLVKQLTETLNQSPNFILVGFEKTSHQTLETIRKKLSPFQAKFKVIKNTLFEKSINKLLKSNSIFFEFKKKFLPLKNSSALLTFKSDWSKGLNAFYDFLKQEKTLSLKSGIIDNQIYGSEQLLTLAQLPSRDQLLSQIINNLKNPLKHFLFSVKFNTTKFIYILKATSEKN